MPLAVMDGCRKNLKYKNRLQRELLKPGDCRILLCIALWAFTESRSPATTGICKTFAVEHHLPLLESKCATPSSPLIPCQWFSKSLWQRLLVSVLLPRPPWTPNINNFEAWVELDRVLQHFSQSWKLITAHRFSELRYHIKGSYVRNAFKWDSMIYPHDCHTRHRAFLYEYYRLSCGAGESQN